MRRTVTRLPSTHFIINRSGKVNLERQHVNQCRSVGHQYFQYDCKVYCSTKLDENGFVIDHNDMDRSIRDILKHEMNSCENLALNMLAALKHALWLNNTDWHQIWIKIEAIQTSAYEPVEASIEIEEYV